jgi:hypothetical protein
MNRQNKPEQDTAPGPTIAEVESSAIDSAKFMAEEAQQQSGDPEVIAATVVAAAICYHAERFVDGCELIANAVQSSKAKP